MTSVKFRSQHPLLTPVGVLADPVNAAVTAGDEQAPKAAKAIAAYDAAVTHANELLTGGGADKTTRNGLIAGNRAALDLVKQLSTALYQMRSAKLIAQAHDTEPSYKPSAEYYRLVTAVKNSAEELEFNCAEMLRSIAGRGPHIS